MYPDAVLRCRKAGGAVGAFRSYGPLLIRRRLLGDSVPSSSSSIIRSPSVSSCNVVAGTVPAAELAGVGMVFVLIVIGSCRELLENDEFTEEVCGGETPVTTDEWNLVVVVVLEAAWLVDM